MRGSRVFLVVFGSVLLSPAVRACPWCRVEVQEAVYSPDFLGTTLLLLLPLLLIALIGVGLHFVDRGGPAQTDS